MKLLRNRRCRWAPVLPWLAMWLAGMSAAPAAEYHVALTGDDANPGSAARPLRTIAKAASLVKAGDTCFVAEGVYPERVTVRKSGTPDSPITFAASGRVRMRGFDLDRATDVRIAGFEITDVPPNLYGIFLKGAHRCQLWHNHIHHLTGGGIRFYQGEVSNGVLVKGNTIAWCGRPGEGHLAITASGDRILIEHNDISHVHDFVVLFGSRNILRNNHFHDAYWADFPGSAPHIDGMQHYVGLRYFPRILKYALTEANFMANVPDQHTHYVMLEDGARMGSSDLLFRRNVGWKLGGYAILAEQVRNVRVFHNTFADLFLSGPTKAWYCLGFTGGATGGRVINNVFSGCARDGGRLYETDAQSREGFAADYNLAYRSGSPRDTHGIAGKDPLFRDAGAGDLRLRPGSPAIDAGGPLTLTREAGSGREVPVLDAGFFTDGWGIAEGDAVRIGAGAPARLVAVDYEQNTLSLDRALSWAKGDGVSQDYEGTAPDIGAYEAHPGEGGSRGITIKRPAPGEAVAGTVQVEAACEDPRSVRHVVFFVDGVPGSVVSRPPYRFQWDTAGVPAGSHALMARAYARDAGPVPWTQAEERVRVGPGR